MEPRSTHTQNLARLRPATLCRRRVKHRLGAKITDVHNPPTHRQKLSVNRLTDFALNQENIFPFLALLLLTFGALNISKLKI